MMPLKREGPFDDPVPSVLDRGTSDNSVIPANDEGSDCENLNWNSNDNLMEVASCEDQGGEMIVSDSMMNAPWRSRVELPPLRDCDDCWGWSEYEYDGSTRLID